MRVKVIMKKILILSVVVGLFGCQYHDSPIWNNPRIDFNAAKGDVITAGFPGFQVLIESISDSRCPSNVVCIWQGQASVTFQIVSAEYSMKNTFSLLISQSKNFSVGQKNYVLTLTDVTPYPNGSNGNEAKKAVFTIKPL